MKKISLSLSLVALGAACSQQPLGTLNNQGAFGHSYVDNQTAQLAYGSEARLKNLGTAFANTVPTMINFEFNQSTLDAEARRVLGLQAEWIKRHPNVRFSVHGHTDMVGGNSYNQRLGLRRARNAVNHLVSLGVNRSQLKALVSRGESQPLVASGGPERLNRRAVTGVSGFLRTTRGAGLDGKRALIVYNEFVGDEGSEVVVSE